MGFLGGGGVIRPLLTPSAPVEDTAFYVVQREGTPVVLRDGQQVTAYPGIDAVTRIIQIWVGTVVAAGGSVSAGRQTLVSDLVEGLMSDGVWAKLDRLWLFAAENAGSALTDLKVAALATAVSSPTFTTDRGYTGNGTSSYIDGNINPNTAGGNYTRNAASVFAWSLTSTQDPGGIIGTSSNEVQLFQRYVTDVLFWRINRSVDTSIASTDGSGFWDISRTASSAEAVYRNGSSFATASGVANVTATSLRFLLLGTTLYSASQVACGGLGGGFNSTEAANFYTRLRTYMTAVGVP